MREKMNAWADKFLSLQEMYHQKEKIYPFEIAQDLMSMEKFLSFEDTQEIFYYDPQEGIYKPADSLLSYVSQYVCGKRINEYRVKEIKKAIVRYTVRKREDVCAPLELIPLENGVYNFKTKELLDFSEEYVFFSKHPIKYLGETWQDNSFDYVNPIETFLTQVTSNQEDLIFLKELIGYCFYRALPFHTITLLVGSGANGKSVFLEIVRRLLGRNNVAERTLQDLAENRFAVQELNNKNANIVGDLPAKALVDTGVLKRASGDDVLVGEKKYGQPFNFKPYAKIICAANELPETPDHSAGFFRRMEVINFPQSFEGRENRNLVNELCTEKNLSLFFLSCINAFWDALKDNSWIKRDTVAQKQEKYYNYSNSAVAFCVQLLDYDPDSEMTTQQIFKMYKDFCLNKRLILKDERSFFVSLYRHFSNRVYKKRRTVEQMYGNAIRKYVVIGVTLRDNNESKPEGLS